MTKKITAASTWAFLQKYGAIWMILGGLSLITGGVWYLIARDMNAWVQGFLIGGLIAAGIYALLRPQDIRRALSGRAARYGSNALILSIAVIGIVVLLNYLSNRHYKRFDLTEIKQHTLSEQSLQILAGLDQEIEIIGFYPSGSGQESFEKWMDEYQAHTDQIRYWSIDPDLEPGKADLYEWSAYGGGLLVRRGAQSQKVTTPDEQEITSALFRVSRDEQKTIYFLTGHQERSPTSYDQGGYSDIGDVLVDYNYAIKPLNLAISGTVPTDAAAIVIAGPQTPLLQEEKQKLDEYLSQGGKALIMAEPGVETGLNEVLAPWGVRINKGLVVDSQLALGGDPVTPVLEQYLFSQVTKDLPMVVLPVACPIEQTAEVENVTVSLLGQSSDLSWAKPELSELDSMADLEYDEQSDQRGPLTLLASVEATTESGEGQTRLVLIGDTDLVANDVLRQIPNGQLLVVNAINWLAEEETLIAIGPKTNVPRAVYLTLVEQGVVCFGTLILIPGIILAAGILVWWKRR